jgi:transcriptional regulator with GAF, ATPase, and Fis domain
MEERCRDIAVAGVVPVELPPLRVRQAELPRIIDEYAQEALAAFSASRDCLTEADRTWMLRHAHSIVDIEKMTCRTVVVRSSSNIAQAATLLGMASVSLSRWLARRSFKHQSSKGHLQNAREVLPESAST